MNPAIASPGRGWPMSEPLITDARVSAQAVAVEAAKRFNTLLPRVVRRMLGEGEGAQQALQTGGFVLDDAVIVEGEYARVEEIGTCFVVLRVWDDRRLIVPLSYFIEKPFQNWTHSSSELLGTVMLYVDYSMPLAPIRQEFERILAETKEWDKRVKAVQVTDTTNQHMEIRLLMSAVNSAVLFDLRCIVREKMLDFLQAHYSDHLPLERQLHSELGDLDTHEHKAA